MVGARCESPGRLSDAEFWQIVTDFSEAGGRFQLQYMSNEDSLQFVIPALKEKVDRDGVYGIGFVRTEQNFTYIAALHPKLAFVVDIRRDNMLEHLMYKALFELSTDRADFVSRLFSRKRPARSRRECERPDPVRRVSTGCIGFGAVRAHPQRCVATPHEQSRIPAQRG